MNTLLLDVDAWDLVVDADGNIAMAANPYAQAQDAASAVKTFLGEVYYDTSIGVPYFQQILGQLPPLSFIKAKFIAAALTVPGVVAAVCFFSSFKDRTLAGQIQITNDAGVTLPAAF